MAEIDVLGERALPEMYMSIFPERVSALVTNRSISTGGDGRWATSKAHPRTKPALRGKGDTPSSPTLMIAGLPLRRMALASSTPTGCHMKLSIVICMASLAGCSSLSPRAPLTESSFSQVHPGMTSDQVVSRLGPPTWTYRVRQDRMTILNYRFDWNGCIVYSVSVLPNGVVRDVGPQEDPRCDKPD
jgi:hypothetical protein